MFEFKPVRQPRVSEVVSDRIKRAIVTGRFTTGDKLPSERELADQFEVSRVAVREALRTLETAGFITTRQGASGGAFVTRLSFDHLGNAFMDLFLASEISGPELHQVRLELEPKAAALASERVTPADEAALLRAMEAEDGQFASHRELVIAGTRVHYILAGMSGNRFLKAIIASLVDLNCELVAVVQPDRDSVHPSGVHRSVVEAVLAGQPEAAARAMRDHLADFGDKLHKVELEYRRRLGQSG